ncbi:MAG: transglutaminase family protein [Oceanicoccus sp.]
MNSNLEQYLQAGPCVDSDAEEIITLAHSLTEPSKSARENAVALYYFVRDTIRYNPYTLGNSRDDWRATKTLEAGEAWCVPKAVLLAALCRAIGIPARLGYADVVNHLSTERLRDSMETDVFYYHGYCSICIDGQWIKSTPAFNLSLCEKFGLKPLDWDGTEDSLYHEFDEAGNRHMEYVNDRGEHADVPYDDIIAVFKQYYPNSFGADNPDNPAKEPGLKAADWDEDVAREIQ